MMILKKRLVLFTLIIISCIMLNPIITSVHAAYEVEVKSEFKFDILKCENNFEIGNITAYAQGFEIDSHHFDQGTTVNLNITSNFLNLLLDYNISADGYSEIEGCSIFDNLNHATYIEYPQTFLDTYYNTSDWNTTTLEVDPGYIFIPFINNATFTWADRVDEIELAQNQTLLSGPEYNQTSTNGVYTNTTDEFYFEFYMFGVVHYNVTDNGQFFNMTIDVDHHYQFAYNKTDNSLLGLRIAGWLDGDSNGSKLAIEYDYHTELVGYNLPDLTFDIVNTNGNGSPTNSNLPLILGLSIGIPVFLILAAVIVVTTLKKKKKQG